ncbi:SGNH/GDSL hydrolase family protein [Kordia jejudonensis]|uniref:SGNH/GDSL hydrolase family protein n=1 Tax=Kordia jejudonensis TaxID=1348245 RepID=UPI000A5D0ABA|nr:SGNH/GDSL hydrolase family protein [Kordia jejudonensis]
MNIKYVLGAIVSVPLLPLLYVQGKKIRKTIPQLPEATGIEGSTKNAGKESFQLITIGESTIAGVGATTHEKAFTGTLANELATQLEKSISWKVYAKSGYTAERVHDKIVERITEKPVDLIVIGLGGNDSFKLHSPKKWNIAIRKLIAKIRISYPETPIVFINMPPIKEFPAFTGAIRFVIGNLVQLLGKELEKVVQGCENVHYYSRTITYDDFIDRMNLDATPADFFSDGVHPSELAYQVWARDVAEYIKTKKII